MNTKNSNNAARTKRMAYSLAAGAAAGTAALGAGDAHGVIVYNDINPGGVDFTVYYGGAFPFNMDIYEGSATADILLKNYNFGSPYVGASVSYYPGQLVSEFKPPNGYAYVTALTDGDPINATTVGPSFFGSMAFSGNPNAEFDGLNGAFIGFSFPDAASNLLYGWIRVNVDTSTQTFEILDWAYESDPSKGIVAGTVPEPGTLGLLAAGAVGVGAMRRRKKQASA